MVEPRADELRDLANGLDYALSDIDVQQVNFTKRQAEMSLWAIRAALSTPPQKKMEGE